MAWIQFLRLLDWQSAPYSWFPILREINLFRLKHLLFLYRSTKISFSKCGKFWLKVSWRMRRILANCNKWWEKSVLHLKFRLEWWSIGLIFSEKNMLDKLLRLNFIIRAENDRFYDMFYLVFNFLLGVDFAIKITM